MSWEESFHYYHLIDENNCHLTGPNGQICFVRTATRLEGWSGGRRLHPWLQAAHFGFQTAWCVVPPPTTQEFQTKTLARTENKWFEVEIEADQPHVPVAMLTAWTPMAWSLVRQQMAWEPKCSLRASSVCNWKPPTLRPIRSTGRIDFPCWKQSKPPVFQDCKKAITQDRDSRVEPLNFFFTVEFGDKSDRHRLAQGWGAGCVAVLVNEFRGNHLIIYLILDKPVTPTPLSRCKLRYPAVLLVFLWGKVMRRAERKIFRDSECNRGFIKNWLYLNGYGMFGASSREESFKQVNLQLDRTNENINILV